MAQSLKMEEIEKCPEDSEKCDMNSKWEGVSKWMDGGRESTAKEEKEYSEGTSRPTILDYGILERSVTHELLHNSFHYPTNPLLPEPSIAKNKKELRKQQKQKMKKSANSKDQKPKKIFDILNDDEDEFGDLWPDFIERWRKSSYQFEDKDEEQRCRRFLYLSERIYNDEESFLGQFLTIHLTDIENCRKRLK